MSNESNYLSSHASALRNCDPRLCAGLNVITSSDQLKCVNTMPKDSLKESDYVARIQQLENCATKWNQAQASWFKEKNRLEFKKSELQHLYDEMKRSSEALQSQLNEIQVKTLYIYLIMNLMNRLEKSLDCKVPLPCQRKKL